jgi:hypothetical protein
MLFLQGVQGYRLLCLRIVLSIAYICNLYTVL